MKPQTVADFYAAVMAALADLGIEVRIDVMPNEIVDAIRFTDDRQHASYDADAAHRFWSVLANADRVFREFRTAFLGKASPVHFWWGSFDLAVSRFSGRTAPPHPGGVPGLPDRVAREAYSHEVISGGFWAGGATAAEPFFYGYIYPEAEGYRASKVAHGHFDETFGEFVLPYADVRASADPERTLREFLQSNYEAAADLAHWDRPALERAPVAP